MSREGETPSDPSTPDLSGLETLPYLAALNEDWKSMESFYKEHPGRLPHPLAIDKDTAFHIAAYSGQTELLQQLLDLLDEPSKILAALSYTNSNGNNTFHEVAITDKVEAAKLLISKLEWACEVDKAHGYNPETKLNELLEMKNKLGETVLYRAAALGKIEVLKVFAAKVPVGNLTRHFRRNDDVSILHIAVIGQHFVTGNWLLEKDNGSLGTQKGLNGMTCLQLLARMPSAFKSTSRMGKMERLLYDCLPASYHDEDNDSNGVEARTPSNQKKDLESGQATTTRRQFNKPLSVISRIYCAIWIGIAKVISRIYCAIWIGVANAWPAIDEIWKMKRKHTAALKITKSLVQMDTTWENSCGSSVSDKTISLGKADCLDDGVSKNIEEQGKEREGDQSNTTHEGGKGGGGAKKEPPCESNRTINYPLLFIAVSEGIVEIFDEILKVHPQAIEHVTSNEQNILHVAIRYRQKEIFRRVKKMKTIRDCRLASRIDNKGYTILHHVADYKGLENYDGVTKAYYGPAFQLQAELKWLEHVRKIMPSHYVMHRNDYKKTADELFKESHAKLLKNAQEWIKETAQSCSTVAVLVATVVFAAAYTVPGGNDNKGHPNFLHSPFFLFFTITDVVSLASSLTSVVMFLSILTSPFEQENFLRSLPRKLMVGFTFLFFSVTTTMLSFSATVLLIIRLENKTWTTTLIYSAAFLPVAVFALMQFPLYLAFTSSLHSILKRIMKKVPHFFKRALKARSPDT